MVFPENSTQQCIDNATIADEPAHRANGAPNAHLDIHARGFWERQRSVFFDVRVCFPNADSYRDLSGPQADIQAAQERQEEIA